MVETQVRTGHIVLGLLKTKSLRNALLGISKEFDKVGADDLAEKFAELQGSAGGGPS